MLVFKGGNISRKNTDMDLRDQRKPDENSVTIAKIGKKV